MKVSLAFALSCSNFSSVKRLHCNRFFSNSFKKMSATKATEIKGTFKENVSHFLDWVKADGSTKYPPEANRYHLYVSYACPFAHRTLLLRSMKGLQDVISVNVVDWLRTEAGWRFNPDKPGVTADTVNGYEYLKDVYGGESYTGKVTTPVLYDKKNKVIVSNDSAEIARMLNSEFNEFCATPEQKNLNLYPEALQADIDAANEWILPTINYGVYKAGFAQTQEAYDVAVIALFENLEKVETILSKTRYLTGNQLTEADIRLFVTLIRFDCVYHLHFKCNRKRIIDYPNMWAFLRDIYQTPGVKETVNMEHISKHYPMTHRQINPFGIVPINPILDFDAPHGRENM